MSESPVISPKHGRVEFIGRSLSALAIWQQLRVFVVTRALSLRISELSTFLEEGSHDRNVGSSGFGRARSHLHSQTATGVDESLPRCPDFSIPMISTISARCFADSSQGR